MMNRLRNSATPASTWFGGMVGVPRALRVSDRTTMTLVNEVVSTSSAGATERTVSSRMLTVWLGLPPTGSSFTETLPVPLPGLGVGVDGSAPRAVTAGPAATAGGAACAVAAAETGTNSAARRNRSTTSGLAPRVRVGSCRAVRAGDCGSATTGRLLAQRLEHHAEVQARRGPLAAGALPVDWVTGGGTTLAQPGREAGGQARLQRRGEAGAEAGQRRLRRGIRQLCGVQLPQDLHRALGDPEDEHVLTHLDHRDGRGAAQAVARQDLQRQLGTRACATEPELAPSQQPRRQDHEAEHQRQGEGQPD